MGFYKSIDSNKVVDDEDAFDNAIDEVTNNEELKSEFVEWFYSGNWVRKD